jgi:hypothetical protein
MTFTGDIDSLGRIASGLASLADVPRVAAPLASTRIEALIQLQFDAGVDPYGAPWQPLAPATVKRGRHAPPLTDTREMRDSLLVYPGPDGIRITIGTTDHPAGPHQDGWSGPQGSGPARKMLPEHGMPESWDWAIEDATIEAVTEKLKEGRAT